MGPCEAWAEVLAGKTDAVVPEDLWKLMGLDYTEGTNPELKTKPEGAQNTAWLGLSPSTS